MRRAATLLILSALLALAPVPSAHAQNSQRAGDLVLHYSAIPSTTLAPEIARQYAITRSANRALVNIAIRRGPPGEPGEAVAARVSVAVTNASGQRDTLRVREVREGDAIYYLAEARFAGNEKLAFEVEAVPEGGAPMRASFRQEFFPQ